MIIHLVLQMMILNVLLVLVPPTFFPINIIYGLMLASQSRDYSSMRHKKYIGPLIHYIRGGTGVLVLLVMVEVVLVLVTHNSTPRKLIFS